MISTYQPGPARLLPDFANAFYRRLTGHWMSGEDFRDIVVIEAKPDMLIMDHLEPGINRFEFRRIPDPK